MTRKRTCYHAQNGSLPAMSSVLHRGLPDTQLATELDEETVLCPFCSAMVVALLLEIEKAVTPRGHTDLFAAASQALHEHIQHNRAQYIRAWLAKTGIDPAECMLVERPLDDGGVAITVEVKQ